MKYRYRLDTKNNPYLSNLFGDFIGSDTKSTIISKLFAVGIHGKQADDIINEIEDLEEEEMNVELEEDIRERVPVTEEEKLYSKILLEMMGNDYEFKFTNLKIKRRDRK